MTAGPVVCDASPLIALDQIGQLELLRHLFGTILVPPAVVRETGAALVIPSWITEQSLG
jgi:predicted nucleic acid-binding protein